MILKNYFMVHKQEVVFKIRNTQMFGSKAESK